jgi:hypothetical protein
MFAKCLTSLSLRKPDFKKNFNQHLGVDFREISSALNHSVQDLQFGSVALKIDEQRVLIRISKRAWRL